MSGLELHLFTIVPFFLLLRMIASFLAYGDNGADFRWVGITVIAVFS